MKLVIDFEEAESNQSEITRELQVSKASITSDVQYLHSHGGLKIPYPSNWSIGREEGSREWQCIC